MPENYINVEKIDATYKDGILKVKLPKIQRGGDKKTRQIKIN